MKKILVVEDEPDIRELLASYLRNEGYDVAAAEDGVAALSCFSEDKFDLVILDIMIPKIDGYGVCEVIKKQSDVPVLMLSALGEEKDLIRGYDSLADDYMTKPFSMPVLLRKVSAILRRNDAPSDEEKSASSVVCGELTLIPDRMEVLVSGKSVEVTSREFDILLTLAKHPGRIFTREMLLDMLWDYNSFVDERIVDSHIKNLRHKLGGDYIETVRGRGYRIGR
ncbi:MAG: response regulator transcription factor [Clostridiales bacterium]|nr:response regulator transcription factor [Clostridiales bacterium]MBR5424996.1 response regulator transcription factor [Clostridiales bacterium]MBR6255374.1 response regulator transcription factor [Clostridiales bacterium]